MKALNGKSSIRLIQNENKIWKNVRLNNILFAKNLNTMLTSSPIRFEQKLSSHTISTTT